MHTRSRVSRLVARLVLVVAALSVGAAHVSAQDRPIRLRVRTFVPPSNVAPGSGGRAALSAPAGKARHYLLQFHDRITPDVLQALRANGITPLRVVPENALAVAARGNVDPASIPGLRWIGALDPNDKLSPESRKDLTASSARYPFTVIEFHPDTTAADASGAAHDAGAVPIDIPGLPPYMLVIQTDRTAIAALAALDDVAWIFPASAALTSGQPAMLCAGLVSDGGGVVASYATEGEGWDGPGRNAIGLGYVLKTASPDLSSTLQAAELGRAMDEWSRYVAVDFSRASATGASRSVDFLWGPANHGDAYPFSSGVIAHAFYPAPLSAEPLAGDVHFNDDLLWGASQPGRYDVFSVALHELGHALGLNHSSDPDSVMYPTYQGFVTGLSASDIETVRMLYATRDQSGLPSQWTSGDIGTVSTHGSVSFANGKVTIKAAGADIWDIADEFAFASEQLAGDGDVVARVDSLQNARTWTKAGVMIRDSRDPAAAHVFMLVSGGKGLAFQRRRASGGTSVSTDSVAGSVPKWLRLTRRGDRFEAYAGDDGRTWKLIGADTIKMGEIVEAGVALSSHDETSLATAVFSNVSIAVVPGWTGADIGRTGLAGSQTIGADQIQVSGAGADIWAAADAFRFVWRPMSGDGDITARVASLDTVRAWTKAGVMIRASRDASAPHAMMLVSAGKGLAFQARLTNGGQSVNTSAGTSTAPVWLRLTRRGDTLSAYWSANGQTWQLVGSEIVAMGRDVLAGLAVSSHTETARARAVFDGIQLK